MVVATCTAQVVEDASEVFFVEFIFRFDQDFSERPTGGDRGREAFTFHHAGHGLGES